MLHPCQIGPDRTWRLRSQWLLARRLAELDRGPLIRVGYSDGESQSFTVHRWLSENLPLTMITWCLPGWASGHGGPVWHWLNILCLCLAWGRLASLRPGLQHCVILTFSCLVLFLASGHGPKLWDIGQVQCNMLCQDIMNLNFELLWFELWYHNSMSLTFFVFCYVLDFFD